jgi:4-hydroxy-tetrahydrodipicolinate synthase
VVTKERLPSGIGVALVTLFDHDGVPDALATAARARRCVELGVSSVLVAGTTGEAARLSVRDRLVLAAAVKCAVPQVPIIVGTGHPDTARALEATASVVKEATVDAVLAFCPKGEDPKRFFRALRDVVPTTPLLAYHNPALEAEPLGTAELASFEVDGVKDSSGSTYRLADLVDLGMTVYVGSPTQLSLAGPCGARGALLALANVAPTDCIAAWNGDPLAQRRLFTLHRQAVLELPASLKRTEPR